MRPLADIYREVWGRNGVPWEHLEEVGTILERNRRTNAVWKRIRETSEMMCGDFEIQWLVTAIQWLA